MQTRTEAQETVDRVRHAFESPNIGPMPERAAAKRPASKQASATSFMDLPEYEILKIKRAVGDIAGIQNPFHRLHDARAADTTLIDGKTVVNFSSYDYL